MTTVAQNIQLRVLNRSSTTIDFSGASKATLTAKPWKWASDGSVTYGSEITLADANVSLADGAAQAFTFDNSTDKWEGFFLVGLVDCQAAGADGVVDFRLVWNTGPTGDYPSSAANFNEEEDTRLLISVPTNGVSVRSRNGEL